VLTLAAAVIVSGPLPANIPSSAWLGTAYLCVMCSAVCFLLQTVGQKYTPPSAAAVIMTLESVFGTLISIMFYGEKLTVSIDTGFVLIFASVLISETKLSFLRKKVPA
jgi:drug/metabolite transporter (DMT)-like permease